MVDRLHKVDLQIELTFGTIPISDQAVINALHDRLSTIPHLEAQSLERFTKALRSGRKASRIAVYGGYPKYFPIVFSSVLAQLQDRWAGETEEGKAELWKWKRTRPLAAAVGMSREEQRAMILGWYLGRALGLIHQPASARSADPIGVFDVVGRTWLSFASRQLTARDRYREPESFEWLPGILEGHTLAVVNTVDDGDFQSLKPYQALRRIWDRGLSPAQDGNATSGMHLIADWLRTGDWPSGEESPIDDLRKAEPTPQARAQALKEWVEQVRDWVGESYLTTSGLPGQLAAQRLRITSVDHLDTLSLFGELALDVHGTLANLIAAVDRALEFAVPGGGTHAPPQV
jgi:hypothetical protein